MAGHQEDVCSVLKPIY